MEQVQAHAPPPQETFVIGNQGRLAGVGDAVEIVVELGPKVADGLHQGAAEGYDRPRLCLCSWAWLRTKSRLNWVISRSRRLSRRCSSIHERTSSRKSRGT